MPGCTSHLVKYLPLKKLSRVVNYSILSLHFTNTLVMGIPLLKGSYVEASSSLMAQSAPFECIIWLTLMLFLFQNRDTKILIVEQLPHTAYTIVSFGVECDILSLDGKGYSVSRLELSIHILSIAHCLL
ncbi:hypothetical protein RJ640_009556 [Escallonia rubra]|uniref:Uncharacterized protein n=1 Tax=Escallonia rubra TaxID=112253 RepID=A0AA88UCX8_9ASTE|nr:hypothetical protein RJ640_009556 [Escallonia rubra]